MDIKQLEQYLMQSDLGIDAKQLERFLSECDLDDKGFPPEELVSYIRRQIYDFKRLMAYYRCAIMEIETKFNVINEDFSYQYERNPIESIKSRLKEPTSIRDKLARRGLAFSAASIEENLFDVAGVRVVCSFVDDVYRIADALVQQDDITLIRRKDYIANPKENGYRSLHLIVAVPIFLTDQKKMMNVEIQLRTIAMDFWASLEHQLRYKKRASFHAGNGRRSQDLCRRFHRARHPHEQPRHQDPRTGKSSPLTHTPRISGHPPIRGVIFLLRDRKERRNGSASPQILRAWPCRQDRGCPRPCRQECQSPSPR